jgi:hypothetical protein
MPVPRAEEFAAPTTAQPALSATSDTPIIEETPVSAETPAEQPVDGEVETPDTDETAEEAGEADDQPQEQSEEVGEKRARSPQQEAAWARIRKQAQAEKERADKLDGMLQDALKRIPELKAPEPKDDPKPRVADYVDPDAWETELLAWNKRQIEPQIQQQTLQQIQQREREARGARLFNDFKGREEKFIEDHPDYTDVISDDLPINGYVAEAIFSVDNGPAVHYWLGQNRDEAARLNDMSVAAALAEIGKISARLAAPPPRPPRVRTEPVKALGSRSDTVVDPNDMDMASYAAWHRERQASRA